jgi:hypothetical protein
LILLITGQFDEPPIPDALRLFPLELLSFTVSKKPFETLQLVGSDKSYHRLHPLMLVDGTNEFDTNPHLLARYDSTVTRSVAVNALLYTMISPMFPMNAVAELGVE